MKLSPVLPLICGVLLSSYSQAHGVVTAYIDDIRVEVSGKVIVTFDQDVSNAPPQCASSNSKFMAFDLNSPGGDGILSLALAAQSTGKMVTSRGTGSCTVWNVFEDVGYMVIRGT